MNKKIFIILFILLTLGALGVATGQDEASEIIRMDTSAFETLRRPAALFDHDTHNENAELEDCEVCHHVWEDGRVVEGESSEDSPCSDCHGIQASGDNGMALANAFHTQCRACHIDIGKGPMLCGECHKKE